MKKINETSSSRRKVLNVEIGLTLFSINLNYMTNKISYYFDSKLNILFKKHYGKISYEDIKSSWINAIDQQMIPKETVGCVLDYTEALIDVSPEQSELIADFYHQHLGVFGGLKMAIVTDNPKNVVICMLVNSKNNGYTSRPFCDMDSAIRWVLVCRTV